MLDVIINRVGDKITDVHSARTARAYVAGRDGQQRLLFTANSGVLPSLLFFLGFFGPIIGITLGFDSINSERTAGTL